MNPQDGQTPIEEATYPFSEAATALDTQPHLLWRYSQRFALFLGNEVTGEHPHYSAADLETLRTVLRLQEEGRSDGQIAQTLALRQAQTEQATESDTSVYGPKAAADEAAGDASEESVLDDVIELTLNIEDDYAAIIPADADAMPQALRSVFNALADSQQTVLSNQASMREVVGVIVQDNFNLKGENRKLRERMLELERVLAEYQRREEMRKERLESRLRALEGTVGGLQQQIAQIVQLLRKRRRGWFW
ncbi:MAG: MerR family transcriptional regulator [Caldilineaceae bacterium]|nr:MerR family transcriptional regulator [Caldilineaceae bacterium]